MRFIRFILKLAILTAACAAVKVACDVYVCPGAGDDTLVCVAVACLLALVWEESV